MASFLQRSAWAIIIATLLLAAGPVVPARAQQLQVRAVLFYSPTCPHCHQVIEGTILPMVERYGDQLEILAINTVIPDGFELFRSAMQHFEVPEERWGVPTLIVAETVLSGSIEIPERFPLLVEAGLSQGGIDWPEFPGLEVMLEPPAGESLESTGAESDPALAQPEAAGEPEEIEPEAEQVSLVTAVTDRLLLDPWGNGLSIMVLIGMLVSLPAIAAFARTRSGTAASRISDWAVPALALLGLLVAGYMAYVETTGNQAICGPVGDCNTVQQSKYALLFGVLPVGILGVVGYLAILAGWTVGQLRTGELASLARLGVLVMTGLGSLFSIYLTFLEPFVIGASCAWCLSSAVIMTALLWTTAGPGVAALRRLTGGERS